MSDCECVLKRVYVLHQKTARLVGLEEPLVGIQPDRIGTLNPAQEPFAFFSHDCETADAASTCSQMPSASQKSAIASNGSMAPLLAAPALAHTAMGLNPAARSSATTEVSAFISRRKRSSLGSMRIHSGRTPMIIAARMCAL